MAANYKCDIKNSKQTSESKVCAQVVYLKPELIVYGDVRDLTLGSSLGQFESGCTPGLDCLTNGFL